MNNKTTLVVAAVVFALVGALVFAAIAPTLSEVSAGSKSEHRPLCSVFQKSKGECGFILGNRPRTE